MLSWILDNEEALALALALAVVKKKTIMKAVSVWLLYDLLKF